MNFDGSIMKILGFIKDSEIRNYVFKNFLFEVPGINKGLFVKDARKIVPSLSRWSYMQKDLEELDLKFLIKLKKLMLGEASLRKWKELYFNMTPSPEQHLFRKCRKRY